MILGALLIVTHCYLNLCLDRLYHRTGPPGLRGGQNRLHRVLLHLEVHVRGRGWHQLHILVRDHRHSLQGGEREGYWHDGGKFGRWSSSRSHHRINSL